MFDSELVRGRKEAVKVVLDTNILVSALLFKGELSKIVDLWKNGRTVPFSPEKPLMNS